MWIHDIEGKGEILVVHVDVIKKRSRKLLDHYQDVIEGLFNQLRARGIEVVEAWVATDEEERFATYFGFDYFTDLTVNGRPTTPVIRRLAKELT